MVLEVLQEVAEKKMTLHEIANYCSKVKDLRVVQKKFVHATRYWRAGKMCWRGYHGLVHLRH